MFRSIQMLFALSIIAMLSACGNQILPDNQSAMRPSSETGASRAIVYFPQQIPVAGERTKMAALLDGELVIDAGCLRAGNNNTSYLIIWPPEVSVHSVGDSVEVHDQSGAAVAQVGSRVQLTGGELQVDQAASLAQNLKEPLPESCPGPYWLVGDVQPSL